MVRPGRRPAPCGAVPGCGVMPGCCGTRRAAGRLLLLGLLLLLHLRHAEEDLPPDQDKRREDDGEQRVLLVVHVIGSSSVMSFGAVRARSRRRFRTSRLQSPQRSVEFLDHAIERQLQGGAPADQHIVMAGAQATRRRQPDDFPETAPHAIALDGISDLLRHGEADAYRTTVVSLARLQHERRGRHLAPVAAARKSARCRSRSTGTTAGAAGVRH